MKRYKVTHEVRPFGAIGSFISAARIIHAVNKQEAIEQAQEQWNAAKHETGGVIAQHIIRGQCPITYLGIKFGPPVV